MRVFDSLATAGLFTCLAPICSATVIPSSPAIDVANLNSGNLTTLPALADPDITTSGRYFPGTLPWKSCLSLMVKAMSAMANLDDNVPFRGTVFKPTDPNYPGVQISVVPIPPATELTAGTVLWAMYEIFYKILVANRFQPSLWDIKLGSTRIALISFASPSSTSLETNNQTLSLAEIPTFPDSDPLQTSNVTSTDLTAENIQVEFYETPTRNPLTVAETFVAILSVLKHVGSFPASDRVLSPFSVGGKDVDSHMIIFFPRRTSPPYLTNRNLILVSEILTRVILGRAGPMTEKTFRITADNHATEIGGGFLPKAKVLRVLWILRLSGVDYSTQWIMSCTCSQEVCATTQAGLKKMSKCIYATIQNRSMPFSRMPKDFRATGYTHLFLLQCTQ